MKIETRMEIILTKQDCQLAQANSGLLVELPSLTNHLLIRVVRDEEEKTG